MNEELPSTTMPQRNAPTTGAPGFLEEQDGRAFLREFTLDARGKGCSIRVEVTRGDIPDDFTDEMLADIEAKLATRLATPMPPKPLLKLER